MDIVEKFMKYFEGLSRAYGSYALVDIDPTGKKIVGKPSTNTGNVTRELWQKHLDGTMGLGICPIMDGNNCMFGAIDIDVYQGLDIAGIVSKIYTLGIPLLPVMTKSGGLHCYAFTAEPIPAEMMKQKLGMIASYLGVGDAEIFPKQTTILTERGDIGNWINMPYYNMAQTRRYAMGSSTEKLAIEEALLQIERIRWNKVQFFTYTLFVAKEIIDGPPCLQTLTNIGLSEGMRNDCLFNVAIYLKRSSPQNWESLLDEYNVKLEQPLKTSDINSIVKSVRKKDYNYTCKKPPIKNYCNAALCRTREYGVSGLKGGFGELVLTNLTKYASDPPIWFIDVEEAGRLELTTEDIHSQQKFQRRCMDSLNILPIPMPQPVWQSIIQDLLKNVTVIEAADDASPRGLLFEYLERFCTSRVQARTMDEILMGKPFTENGFHYFRLSDFYSFLDRMRFREYKVNQISSMLKDEGGMHEAMKIKGKGVNVWKFPAYNMQEAFDIPHIEDKEIL